MTLFTIEETQFLKQLLLQFGNGTHLKDSVLHKLESLSETNEMGIQLVNIQTGAIIAKLQEAMEQQKQVLLKTISRYILIVYQTDW